MKIRFVSVIVSLLAVFYLAVPKSTGEESRFSMESLYSESFREDQAKIDTLEKRLARLQTTQNGVIRVPIVKGFPYCEPFTSTQLERENTKVGGSAILTETQAGRNDGVLRLTNVSSDDQLGYAFVDFPLSSTYGLKVSFEFFIYNNSGIVGDGISFFLFDGAIPASEFRIGGLGGSLGYAPHGYSPGGFTGNPVTGQGFGGLQGGYLGIGFDVYGNFGNEFYRKYGGFQAPNSYWATDTEPNKRYPNSVVVRGPQVGKSEESRRNGLPPTYPMTGLLNNPSNFFESYKFITGKVLYDDSRFLDPSIVGPSNPILRGQGALPKTNDFFVSPQFYLGTQGKVDDCTEEGYRKVFIDFKPIVPGVPSAGYKIDVDMLVNVGGPQPVLVEILSTTFFPDQIQPVPPTFKLGFAGATGERRAFQEIRNVTVQVSNEDELKQPTIEKDINAIACVGEEEFFELNVDLQNLNSQIQCIQLYKTEAEALAVQGQLSSITNVQDCNSGICQLEVCKQERIKVSTSLGEFEAFIFLENIGGKDKEVPKIKFKSTTGATGTTTIWFTVTDNFGQISEPKKINITINPTPKIDGTAAIIGPTCNGQNDGTISNVIIKDLIPGYTVVWKDPAGNIVPASKYYTESETTVGGYIRANLGLKNVNLGEYTLIVNNPATNGVCDDVFKIRVGDVRGTPVKVILDDQKICQGTPVVFDPELEDATDAANPRFTWWKDNQKTKPITNGLTEGNVKYTITGSGTLTVTGLVQNSTPYEYFVEVTTDPTQNICATPVGNPLKKVKVLVVAPLVLSANTTPDLCLLGLGQVQITASGGLSSYTYSLDGSPFQTSNTFTGLSPGNYTVTVNAGTNCLGTIPVEIKGAPPLILKDEKVIQPSCGFSNGVIEVSFTGGNPAYKLELFKNGTLLETSSQVSSPKVYKDLSPGKYDVKLTDDKGCTKSFTKDLVNVPSIPISVDVLYDELCVGDQAVILPKFTTTGAVQFKWYKDLAATQQILSGPTADANGHIFTINPTTFELNVSGLKKGDYTFYLVAEGSGYCPAPPYIATIKVLDPISASIKTTDEKCFGAADGTISITANGADGNFDYSLDGVTFQSSNTFTGLSPGNYTVTVRAGTKCLGTFPTEIKGPPALILKDEKVIQPACGTSNGLIEVSFTGGTPAYKLELFKNGTLLETSSPASSPKVYKDLSPGKYEVRITDGNECFKFFQKDLVDSPGIPVSVDVLYDELCVGDQAVILPKVTTTGQVQLKWYKDLAATQEILSGPTADANGHIFTINPTTFELKVSGLKKGDYNFYLVAVGPGYCPAPPYKASVKVFEPISATIITTDEICFGASDGTIAITAQGSDGNFEYSLNGGPYVNTPLFTGLSSGNYTIDVRSKGPNGCTYQTTAEVKKPNGPISTNLPTIIRSSCNLNNGRIEDLVISGGWGGYTVEWRRGSLSGPLVPGTLTGAKDLFEDTYYLIVKDQKECIKSFEFRVNDMPDPVFVFGREEICAGQSTTLKPVNTVSGSSPTDLLWFKDAGKTQAISNGTDPADPTISYAIDPTNGNLTINGLKANTNPYSYYLQVVCTDALVKADVLVRAVPNPVFVVEQVSCFGGNDGKILVSTGGDSKYRYSIDGGAAMTENQLESLTFPAKTYSISVTNEGFCLTNFSVEVKQPTSALKVEPLQKVNPGCGLNVGEIKTQVTGGWAPYSITLIKNGTAVQTTTFSGPLVEFPNLGPGTYSLVIKDSEDCEILSNQSTLEFGPTAIQVNNVEICEGQDAVFKPTAAPVPTGAVFQWFKNSALTNPIVSSSTPDANGHLYTVASDGTLTVSGLKSGSSPVTYYVIITGGSSCAGFVATAKAVINRLPTLGADIKNEVCFGEKGSITLLGGAGDGVFSYSLDGTNFQAGNKFDVIPGTYTGYVRSGAGCLVTLPNLFVNGATTPVKVGLPQKTDASCNASDGSITFDITGGYNSSYTVVAKRNGVVFRTITASEGSFTLKDIPSGNYSFTVTDAGGCKIDVPQSVQVEDLLTPLAVSNVVICAGETVVLSPSTTQQGISPVYSWYLNSDGTGQILSGTDNGVTYQVGADGKLTISGLPGRDNPYLFYVKISGVKVCEPPIMPVEVLVYEIPNLRVTDPSIVCDPAGTVDLTQFIEGFNPVKYDYEIVSPSGRAMRLDEIDKVNQSGSYQVKSSIRGAKCWSRNLSIRVLITEEELIPDFSYEADFGGGNFVANAEAQIFEKILFKDESRGKIIKWDWDFGDGTTSTLENPEHTYEIKGTYLVKLITTDNIGCVAEKEQLITVLAESVVMVPNAFTPDGLKNRLFKPQFRGLISMQFFVFSTWGELIFQSDQLDTKGWDGTFNGVPAQNGNYVYKGIFVTRSGEKIEKTGVFLLIR